MMGATTVPVYCVNHSPAHKSHVFDVDEIRDRETRDADGPINGFVVVGGGVTPLCGNGTYRGPFETTARVLPTEFDADEICKNCLASVSFRAYRGGGRGA